MTFSIEQFLKQESEKDLLRFSTAGSVDDGKSTLIGRLLYDTQSVYEDQVRSIEGKGTTAPGQIDFALLTDGLRAEREQGITIDVAYRYFSTAKRKFIIADTPGHEQYTRNMATGASTADAAIVLIDAAKGVLVQSRRHAYIASLLRVRHVLVAVNKMDLIGYDAAKFHAIVTDFDQLLDQIAADTGIRVEAEYVPVSALVGDNIVHRTDAMPWYTGPSLLELLEKLPPSDAATDAPLRFPVQRVLRPDHTFRGFAGQIASGRVRVGDEVVALPSGRSAKIERIVTFDGDLAEAQAPLSVVLVMDRELDISRGDLIAAAEEQATVAQHVQAAVVWMDATPLRLNRRYLLKHTSQTVPAFVAAIDHRTDIATLKPEAASTLEMNSIGVVRIHLPRPIAVDLYNRHRATGAFILIDAETNATVAAGMIRAAGEEATDGAVDDAAVGGPVTTQERATRWLHQGAVVELTGSAAAIDAVERSLFATGAITQRIARDTFEAEVLERILQLAVQSGFIALLTDERAQTDLVVRVFERTTTLDATHPLQAVAGVHQILHATEVLFETERAGL